MSGIRQLTVCSQQSLRPVWAMIIQSVSKHALRHRFCWLVVMAPWIVTLAGCQDDVVPLFSPPQLRRTSIELDECGTKDDPCKLDGLWVIASRSSPGVPPSWISCTTTEGGCFPEDKNPPVVWGNIPVGSSWGLLANSPGAAHRGSVPPTLNQRNQIEFLTRWIACPQVKNDILARLRAGKIRVFDFDEGHIYGSYADSDDTIYIAGDRHWEKNGDGTYGALKDVDELFDTLRHEGIHAWFGTELTNDNGDSRTLEIRDTAIGQC